MHAGLYLPNFGAFGDASTLATFAAAADRAGWEGFFIWDHVARPGPVDVVDPWIALSAIALATTTVRIGALVTPVSRRRPWKLARETVSLDRLEESRFTPVAVQSPRIPVWIGGYWPSRAPFRRAARWDGAFPLFDSAHGDPLAQLADCVRFLESQRSGAGPFDVAHLSPPTDQRGADAAAADAGATWWLERITPDAFGCRWQDEWPLAAMRAHIERGPPAVR